MSETDKKRKGKKKKRILRRIITTVLLVVLLAGAGFYAWARLKSEYTITYDAYTASRGTISNSLSFNGSMALRDSMTYTSSSSAKVRAVYVKNGDAVKKGDRLIRLGNGTTVTADFDGKVNLVSVDVNDEVAAGDTLIQIADFEHMQVSFRVDEYDISFVHPGDECKVTATATEKTFTSQVDAINYISSSTGNVAYYTATANVDVTEEGVYPGMQVTVTIPRDQAENVVILKADALSFTPENKAFVYTMDEEGVLSELPVEVGVSNGNYVEIRTGLKEGDVVYAVTKEKTDTLSSMFASMFGSQQFNNQRRNNWTGPGNQNREGISPNRNNGTGGGR